MAHIQNQTQFASKQGKFISALLLATVIVSQAHAAESTTRDNDEELIGVGSGLVLGAVVGGPVGAFIGAFTGGLIGQSVGDEQALKQQDQLIAKQRIELASLTARSQQLETESRQLAMEAERRIQAQMDALALGMNVQFRTGSSEIEPHFKQQLDDVAYVMSLSP